MSNILVRSSEQIYALLLKLYPADYRREFEKEMAYVFSEQLAESYEKSSEFGVIALWSRTIIDVGKTSIAQHLLAQKGDKTMKTKKTDLIMNNKIFLWLAIATAAILMIPAVMMQISSDWNWGLSDFVIMAVLLFGAGSIFIFAARKAGNNRRRLVIGLVILAVMLWLYAELAVGLFTNWGS